MFKYTLYSQCYKIKGRKSSVFHCNKHITELITTNLKIKGEVLEIAWDINAFIYLFWKAYTFNCMQWIQIWTCLNHPHVPWRKYEYHVQKCIHFITINMWRRELFQACNRMRQMLFNVMVQTGKCKSQNIKT